MLLSLCVKLNDAETFKTSVVEKAPAAIAAFWRLPFYRPYRQNNKPLMDSCRSALSYSGSIARKKQKLGTIRRLRKRSTRPE